MHKRGAENTEESKIISFPRSSVGMHKYLTLSFSSRSHSSVGMHQIDWTAYEKEYGALFDPGQGRPGLPIRLMAGLTYLSRLYRR